jgi:uncharacterized protein YndB with AHSA1/START domain
MDASSSRTDLGTYIELDGRPAVRFERTYPHPVDRVWAAITEPADLVRWFPSAVELEPREGGSVRFSGDPYSEGSNGVVLTWDPPHRLAFTWGPDELHLTVEDAGDGSTRLVLVNVLDDRSTAARNAGGWHVCLGELAKLLEGVPSKGPHSEDAEAWEPIYRAHVDAGLPSGAPVPDIVTG